MGRPFESELAALADTYEWALRREIDTLCDFVRESAGVPLIAVGSGGSATAAHLASLLHRLHAGAFARHTTPLEMVLSEPNLRESAVWLFSASGKNRDVLGALEHCVHEEVRTLATLCTQVGSPLASGARPYEWAHVFEAHAPAGKDGFLATNSLLASCVLTARAYGAALLEAIGDNATGGVEHARGRTAAVVLHAGWSAPVATDLESKLNESAIAAAQVADYRNFGHGRHLGLARRPLETLVIALITPETADLAERTLKLFPPEIPIVQVRTEADGPAGTLDLLGKSFRLIGQLGELQDFDPGRPSVPDFGRKLYHVAAKVAADDAPPPVKRKLARTAGLGYHDRAELERALAHFTARLSEARLGAIVLDYDGTLCGRAERFGSLRGDIATECQRLLEGGLLLGIATGRGRSVRLALQRALPQSLWDQVVVGYYNGGEIALLSVDNAPSREERPEGPLGLAYEHLKGDVLLQSCATLTPRAQQITIEPKHNLSTATLLLHAMTCVARLEHQGIRVLASSHSVDVLAAGVGKLAVVDRVKQRLPAGTEVLCIGDRGAWPGNDCGLLSHWPSLSVDEVSPSLATCWNIAPAGMRGAEATLLYLRGLRLVEGTARLDARKFWGSR